MPVYTRVNWVDGSGGGTPVDAANLNNMDAGIAACVQQDGSTPMTTALTLATGHQETGPVGAEAIGSAAAPTGAGGLVGYMKSFFMKMTNIPTSITLTSTSNTNVNPSYPTVDTITVYGFNFNLGAAAAGLYFWHGTYTTVGNCLLAVDEGAHTFDHHCDVCGAVHQAVGLDALRVTFYPPEWRRLPALAYACPDCAMRGVDTSEHFYTGYTAADEHDETQQGDGEYATTLGAQARLIRALMRLVGLPVAP